ncbi:helix-turn-helix domain-containing protein [Streptococcus cuniculipharyngis]|uniref:Helix-turn-helix transcriptional regulator n=1 Tax=Streptococcus cuniculipharyngis TaxID=1562651 RepID=A0A5C5SBK5_9STRE|nr:helix-turn-helix transcriptional regulator [Streptococcus cuniculipharyngis]TWS97730.1 helix-turn-helix transcriptional regulator [Streptococcus cuniculipharyngis]
MTVLAQQIKSLRKAKNMSQDDLAERLYISRQAISKWETGEATPDLEKLIVLADIFEVSLDVLILGKEEDLEDSSVSEPQALEQPKTFWEFLAEFWWIIFPVLGAVIWFIRSLVEILN